MFVRLKPFEERKGAEHSLAAVDRPGDAGR